MNPGIVFICDHNGIVLHVHRDDYNIFGTLTGREHLSRYIAASSKEVVTRFFALLVTEGMSSSRPIEFFNNSGSPILFCTGMRLRDRFLIFGAAELSVLGALIPGTLYKEGRPLDLSRVFGFDPSPNSTTSLDYKVYEDLTRLNNELVNMSRALSDTQVELEMEADERNKEIQVRRQAEEALSIAIKKLNLLSSITRHDLKNHLISLNGYLGISKKYIDDAAKMSEFITKEEKITKTMECQIAFTKVYESIGVTAPVWQDCRTVIDTAAKQTSLGQVIVKNDLPAGDELFADPLIIKVFYNLMDNAVRYGKKITTIRFSVEECKGDYVVVCQDDGEGVVAGEKEKIFERGFGKNTGMGLFLAREILSITGITIRETGEPGIGAQFEMTVPKEAWRLTGKGA